LPLTDYQSVLPYGRTKVYIKTSLPTCTYTDLSNTIYLFLEEEPTKQPILTFKITAQVRCAYFWTGLVDTQYSNTSSPTSTSTRTDTSTSYTSINTCATLDRLDFFPASLRSLPSAELASIPLSGAVRLQEIIRSFVRYVATYI
jgi:hypothetical protein